MVRATKRDSLKVEDNFLSVEDFSQVESIFIDNFDFPWYMNDKILASAKKSVDDYKVQLTHTFFRENTGIQSNFFQYLTPLIDAIKPSVLLRVKANLGTKTPTHIEGGYHTDFDFSCRTAVFYINNNNGFTLFEDGNKVESKANRFVSFNSNQRHTGVSQTDTNVRYVLNINYII
jgi:hypothetical protein